MSVIGHHFGVITISFWSQGPQFLTP